MSREQSMTNNGSAGNGPSSNSTRSSGGDNGGNSVTELQAEVASLGRVSHRLAMIDNVPQFESVVGKLLPKLLVRMGRNHEQQQQQHIQQPEQVLRQRIQAKLMEIFSHILKRTKESTTTSSSVDKKQENEDPASLREPLPCKAILDLLVQTDQPEHGTPVVTNRLQIQPDLDALTKNLSLTFLTVGVPRCPDPAPLIPPLLVCLHHEREQQFLKLRQQQRQQQSVASSTNASTTAATGTAATTLSTLILHCLVALGKTGGSVSKTLGASSSTPTAFEKLESIRYFLQQHDNCAAVLYELILDGLLWTPASTSMSSLPPPGISQHGQERLQQAIGATPSTPLLVPDTKVALVELIAPARKALLLSHKGESPSTSDSSSKNLARTLTLLAVAKGVSATMERAQTYWQMYMQSSDHHSKKNQTHGSSESAGSSTSSLQQQQQEANKRPVSGADKPRGPSLTSAVNDVVFELLSLSLGQGQAEDIVHQVGIDPDNNNGEKMTTSSAGASSCALPLHCEFGHSYQQQQEEDGPSVWASKRRAVALTPTATAVWTSLASNLLPLVTPMISRKASNFFVSFQISHMVLFLAQKYLTASSTHGLSSAMSAIQARPFLALVEMLEAVTLQLTKVKQVIHQSEKKTLGKIEDLEAKILETVSEMLRVQVATTSPGSISTSSNSSMIMNSEGSWAVREKCYSIVCHLFRSSTETQSRKNNGDDPCIKNVVSIDTVNLLFACAAREHERLRPRAVAALDTLLEAFTRVYRTEEKTESGDPISIEMENPWAAASTTPLVVENIEGMVDTEQKDRQTVAKSLVPLLWNAAQSHQPKSSRVAAARWATEILKKNELDLVAGCHLLCFLAGDSDVTAMAVAKQGLFDSGSEEGSDKWQGWQDNAEDEIGEADLGSWNSIQNTKASPGSFPEFSTFVETVFCSPREGRDTRFQRYSEFSVLGKAASLRYALRCLLMDMYGGDDDAVSQYLQTMLITLDMFASDAVTGQNRSSLELLDQCCVCLLATLKNSSFARREFSHGTPMDGKLTYSLTLSQVEEMVTAVRSSKARRYLASIIGVIYEDSEFVKNATTFSTWMSLSGAERSLSLCVNQMDQIEKSHVQLSKLHGVIYMSGHVLRAIRYRLLQISSQDVDHTRRDCTRLLQLLGQGVVHKEEVLSRASVDAIGIALSFDTLDAPPFDQTLNDGLCAVLMSISIAIRKFCDGESVDAHRAIELVRVGGIALGATSNVTDEVHGDFHKSRQVCLEAIFSSIGSSAFRKEEEIALVAGEALGRYADSCVFQCSDLSWPNEYEEQFALKLPPQERVFYLLLTHTLQASSPHKRTATAPTLLGLVGRAARLVHLQERNGGRSFVVTVRSLLPKIQSAFVSLLADPKIKHFSRESCCLGLAASRGLAVFNAHMDGAPNRDNSVDSMNERLLRAFGQTANYGGSAYQETNQQAAERRAEQRASQSANNILEPFGMESEVGGAAGMGEAALGAYREMAAASLALGRPDILYALLILSISHSSWFVGSNREKYSAASLLGENSIIGSRTNTIELRKALRPHLGKLLPRILRACNDPNKQTREQMSVLWLGLTGGGAEARDAISSHFVSTVDVLIKDASNKLWRARAGACGALGEVIVGRDWSTFGGGPPILSDDDIHDDRLTKYAGVRLLRLWRVVVRAIDDVRDAVRSNGERLGRSLRSLTIRLCDPSILDKTDGALTVTEEQKVTWARDASAACATSIRWLVKHGLNQKVSETQGLCISTLVELIAIAKPAIVEPSLPELLRSLLMSMSSLEPAALNYLQLRTDNQEGLERARLQLAQTGPLAKAVTKCVDLLPHAKLSIQHEVVSELETTLRLSVGFATRAAVADTASMMCTSCPGAFSFPGSGSAVPSVRLMRAFYFAAERERGQGAKDKMVHALGSLAALCPGASVRSLAVRACKRYKSSTGNNDDPSSRQAAAAALRAIAVRASNQMIDGGAHDIWSQFVLPVAFLGQKDSDKKTASMMKEVWDEGGSSVEPPVRYGSSREEQFLPGLVKECIGALQDVSWARRIAGSKALRELCDLGVLGPMGHTLGAGRPVSKHDLERSRRRTEACYDSIRECMKVMLKPRLWTGKHNVVVTLSKLASKWTTEFAEENDDLLAKWDGDRDVWPLSMSLVDGDSLFRHDDYFKLERMETELDVDALNEEDHPESKDDNMILADENDDQSKLQEESDGAKVDFTDMDNMILADDKSKLQEESDGAKVDFTEMNDEDDPVEEDDPENKVEKNPPQSQEILSFVGLCRIFVKEALPGNKVPGHDLLQEYLPYRTACLEAFRDLLRSIPSSNVGLKSLLYSKEGKRLVLCIKGNDSRSELPVIVANAIDCVGQCFWDGFGSTNAMDDDSIDFISPPDLCELLRDVSGKQQPAWTVRRSGALGLAALVAVCDPSLLRTNYNSKVVDLCIECASYACQDRKFWRVREAGLRLLGSLIRRAGPSLAQRESLLLDTLLPYKEDMLKLLRSSLTDSEPTVTALSSELLALLAWWH